MGSGEGGSWGRTRISGGTVHFTLSETIKVGKGRLCTSWYMLADWLGWVGAGGLACLCRGPTAHFLPQLLLKSQVPFQSWLEAGRPQAEHAWRKVVPSLSSFFSLSPWPLGLSAPPSPTSLQ